MAQQPEPGRVLAGRYRVVGPLGDGGMAAVVRAVDERLGREVALKVLRPELAADETLVARFQREARALAAIAHPGVVAIHDVEGPGPDGAPPFLVMELVEAGSLADRLAAEGALPPSEVVAIVEAVAAGLTAIHGAGLVHRDVKPANVLLAPSGPKLGDLGIVGSDPGGTPGDATTLTSPGSLVGTLRYLAPEAMEGDAVGPPADVYGLGLVAYEALTGQPARAEGSLAAVVGSASGPAPVPSALRPELAEFDAPIVAALDPDPLRRPDPGSFAAALRSALVGAPPVGLVDADAATTVVPAAVDTLPPPSVNAPPVPAREPRRSGPASDVPWLLLGALVLIVALIALGTLPSALQEPGEATPGSGASAAPTPAPATAPPVTPPGVPSPVAEALGEFRAALADARGGRGGVRGNEANDLEDLASRIEAALTAGEERAAREAADRLVERTESIVGDAEDDSAGGRLIEAAGAVQEAVGGD